MSFVTMNYAVPWLRRLVVGISSRRSRFALGSVHVGLVIDKVALGQVSLRVLRFLSVNIFPPLLSILIYRSRDSCRDLFKNLTILPLQSQYILSLLLFVVDNIK
jgi:hypothetical protein